MRHWKDKNFGKNFDDPEYDREYDPEEDYENYLDEQEARDDEKRCR